MKMIIEIPDDLVEYVTKWKDFLIDESNEEMILAIANGIPLSEHHGRIIDESKINKVYAYTEEATANKIRTIGTIITGTDAPTVIEASES